MENFYNKSITKVAKANEEKSRVPAFSSVAMIEGQPEAQPSTSASTGTNSGGIVSDNSGIRVVSSESFHGRVVIQRPTPTSSDHQSTAETTPPVVVSASDDSDDSSDEELRDLQLLDPLRRER